MTTDRENGGMAAKLKSPAKYHYCGKKHPYRTERAANRAALGIGLPRNAYQCPKCRWWHMTSRPAIVPSEGVKALFGNNDSPRRC